MAKDGMGGRRLARSFFRSAAAERLVNAMFTINYGTRASAPCLEIILLRNHIIDIDVWSNDWPFRLVADGRVRFRLFSKIDEPRKWPRIARIMMPTW
jgi:hypothetical protein